MQVLCISEFSPPKSLHSSPESSAKLRCYFWLAISKKNQSQKYCRYQAAGFRKEGKKRKEKKNHNTCYSPLAYDILLEYEQDFTSHAVL